MSAAVAKPHADDTGKSIWDKVLEGASRVELPPSQIVVFGRRDCGKSSIVRAMQRLGTGNERKGNEEEFFRDACGVGLLQYAYLTPRLADGEFDEDRSSTISTVIMFQEQNADVIKSLLLPRLDRRLLQTTVIVIVLSLAEPWNLRVELAEWLQIAGDVVTAAMEECTSTQIDTLRENQLVRLTEDNGGTTPAVEINLGIPIVVAVAKSDAVVALDSTTTQGQADVVLAHLRDLCLPYAASLIYCNNAPGNKPKNQDVLYAYIMHRLYNIPLTNPPNLEAPDAIFIPGGTDTREALDGFAAQTIAGGLTKPFETIVMKPAVASGRWNVGGDTFSAKSVEVGSLHSFLEDMSKSKVQVKRVEEMPAPGRRASVSRPSMASMDSRVPTAANPSEFFRTLVKPGVDKQSSRALRPEKVVPVDDEAAEAATPEEPQSPTTPKEIEVVRTEEKPRKARETSQEREERHARRREREKEKERKEKKEEDKERKEKKEDDKERKERKEKKADEPKRSKSKPEDEGQETKRSKSKPEEAEGQEPKQESKQEPKRSKSKPEEAEGQEPKQESKQETKRSKSKPEDEGQEPKRSKSKLEEAEGQEPKQEPKRSKSKPEEAVEGQEPKKSKEGHESSRRSKSRVDQPEEELTRRSKSKVEAAEGAEAPPRVRRHKSKNAEEPGSPSPDEAEPH